MKSDVTRTLAFCANSGSQLGAGEHLLGFAGRFLSLAGAVVEPHVSGIDALVPEELQALLNTDEHIRIRSAGDPVEIHKDCFIMGYGSPLLDKMIEATLRKIPLLYCSLEFDYIKSGGFDRLLNDQMMFYGAVADIETIADVIANYALVICRYKAQSDEQKEGLVEMAFNCDSKKFVPEMPKMLDSAVCRIQFSEGGTNIQGADMLAGLGSDIHKHAMRLIEDQLHSFRESMNRRFKRDVNNLEEYYAGLKTEMLKNLENPSLTDSARKDRQVKIDSLPTELSRKTDDLFKKYTIKVRVNPAAAMIIRTPAKKIICKLSVGRNTRRFFLNYNPVTRAIEPVACARCQKIISHIHFNNNLEPICFVCRSA